MGKTLHPGPIKKTKKWDTSLWVSPVPFGFTKVKPRHIIDSAKVAWKNKDNLNYAKNIILKVWIGNTFFL